MGRDAPIDDPYEALLKKVIRWQRSLNQLDHHFKTRRGSDKQTLADYRDLDAEHQAAKADLRAVKG